MQQKTQATPRATTYFNGVVIGLDLGDRWSRYCVLDSARAILEEDRVRTSAESLRERFGQMASTRIVIETGALTPWSEPGVRRRLPLCGGGQRAQAADDLRERP
jgi:hypothetical protein